MGEVPYARFVRSDVPAHDAELARVDHLARQLRDHLQKSAEDVDLAHVHGASSMSIQLIVARLLRDELQFGEEVVITPQDGLVTRARPDFFYPLGTGRGVLAEVERGGTTTNNHDLKDIWKVHVSPNAQHLFLVVPNANFNAAGESREKPFPLVQRRLAAFFGDARREIDVVSAHVFGYGRRS